MTRARRVVRLALTASLTTFAAPSLLAQARRGAGAARRQLEQLKK